MDAVEHGYIPPSLPLEVSRIFLGHKSGRLAYFSPTTFCAFTVIAMTDIVELLPCARHYFKHLVCINLFDLPNSTMKYYVHQF